MASSHNSEHRQNYSQENVSDQTQAKYPGTDQKEGWQESNHTLNFLRALQDRDPAAADAIDHREDPTRYTETHPEPMGAAILETFKATLYRSTGERNQAAFDLTQALLEPIKDRVDNLEITATTSPNNDGDQYRTLDHIIAENSYYTRHRAIQDILTRPGQGADELNHALHQPLEYPRSTHKNYHEELFRYLSTIDSETTDQINQRFVLSQSDRKLGSRTYDQMSPATGILNAYIVKGLNDSIDRGDRETFKYLTENVDQIQIALQEGAKQNTKFAIPEAFNQPHNPAHFGTPDQALEYIEHIRTYYLTANEGYAHHEDPGINNILFKPAPDGQTPLSYAVALYQEALDLAQGKDQLTYSEQDELAFLVAAINDLTAPRHNPL